MNSHLLALQPDREKLLLLLLQKVRKSRDQEIRRSEDQEMKQTVTPLSFDASKGIDPFGGGNVVFGAKTIASKGCDNLKIGRSSLKWIDLHDEIDGDDTNRKFLCLS